MSLYVIPTGDRFHSQCTPDLETGNSAFAIIVCAMVITLFYPPTRVHSGLRLVGFCFRPPVTTLYLTSPYILYWPERCHVRIVHYKPKNVLVRKRLDAAQL